MVLTVGLSYYLVLKYYQHSKHFALLPFCFRRHTEDLSQWQCEFRGQIRALRQWLRSMEMRLPPLDPRVSWASCQCTWCCLSTSLYCSPLYFSSCHVPVVGKASLLFMFFQPSHPPPEETTVMNLNNHELWLSGTLDNSTLSFMVCVS